MSKQLSKTNNTSKYLMGVGVGMVLATAIGATTYVAADELDVNEKEGLEYRFQGNRLEHRETMDSIMSSGDYNAWKEEVSKHPKGEEVLSIITEDKFPKLQEMHNLRKEGKHEEAKALRDELGLPEKQHGHRQGGHKGPAITSETRFEEFKSEVESRPHGSEILEKVTAQNFDTFKQMHELRQSGDKEAAEALREQLDLPERGQKMGRRHKAQ